jgi:hypothetical protein
MFLGDDNALEVATLNGLLYHKDAEVCPNVASHCKFSQTLITFALE